MCRRAKSSGHRASCCPRRNSCLRWAQSPRRELQAEFPGVEQSEEIQGEPLGTEEPGAWLLPQECDGPAGHTGDCRPSTLQIVGTTSASCCPHSSGTTHQRERWERQSRSAEVTQHRATAPRKRAPRTHGPDPASCSRAACAQVKGCPYPVHTQTPGPALPQAGSTGRRQHPG